MTTQRDIRVCFFGDSFVAGIGDRSGLGWVGRVTAQAHTAGLPLTSYNLGVRRETTPQIIARIPSEGPPRWHGAQDPRLVISCGVNDTTIEDGAERAPLSESVGALSSITGHIALQRTFFIGPPAIVDVKQNEAIHQRDQAFRAAAADLGMTYLSVFAATLSDPTWQQEVARGDGFHPDAGGYQSLAAVIGPPLVGWLSQDCGT